MGKKRKRINLLKEWPVSEDQTIYPEELLNPLKNIVYAGYNLNRRPINDFIYTGYNIGKPEQIYYPSPDKRFTVRWLENETKFKRTLLDNVLITAFHLGVEQGRRINNKYKVANCLLQDIIVSRTQKIKLLREKLSIYDPSYLNNDVIPSETNQELIIDDNV